MQREKIDAFLQHPKTFTYLSNESVEVEWRAGASPVNILYQLCPLLSVMLS